MAGIGGVPLFALGTMASGMPKKPTAPTGLTATANPDSSNRKRVTLSWTAPVNTGFPAVTSYNLEIVGVTTITGIAGTSTTWSSGTINTNYAFRVYAVNSAGVGLVSNTASATVTDVADAPTGLSINNTTTFGSMTASWTAPAYTGSSSITSYTLNVAGVGNVYSGTSTSYTWTGGTKGTNYTFTVYAVTSVGNGVISGGIASTVQGNVATGGSISDVANYNGTGQTWRVHTFTSGSSTFAVSASNQTFRVLVGGGGGGGDHSNTPNNGGGGGGGQIYANDNFSLSVNSYSLTIGNGGAGGVFYQNIGLAGGSTTAFGITSTGGVGSGANNTAGPNGSGALYWNITGTSQPYGIGGASPGSSAALTCGGGGGITGGQLGFAGGSGAVIVAYRLT